MNEPMTNPVVAGRLRCTKSALILFCLMIAWGTCSPALADEIAALALDAQSPAEYFASPANHEDGSSAVVPVLNQGDVRLGYRLVSTDGIGARAVEYESLHSALASSLFFSSLGVDRKFVVDGNYLNSDDYFGDLSLDHQGKYQLHLRTESLFHNLDNEPLFTVPFTLVDPTVPLQLDAGQRYGVRVEQDLAEVRFKPFRYPLHLNLGYWRLLREGQTQLRFADFEFANPAAATTPTNLLTARRRDQDRQTHEGTIGLDSHLGPVELIYQFQVRQLQVNERQAVDPFVARSTRSAGLLAHNVDPESRYLAHTIRMHTSLTGGLVGAASYTYGQRDTLSQIQGVRGSGENSVRVNTLAGDLTYTPAPVFSLAVRYRRQIIDTDNPATVANASFIVPVNPTFPFTGVPGEVATRPGIDTTRDQVSVTATVRPLAKVTINGEYKGEITQRTNTDPGSPGLWHLPEETITQRGTLSLLTRQVKGLRFKAQYSYTAIDHPAYGSSAQQRHAGETLITYNNSGAHSWGLTGGYRVWREWNDQFAAKTLSFDATVPSSFILPRQSSSQMVTASCWVAPIRNFNLTLGYNLLRADVDQTLLLSGITPGTLAASSFASRADVYSVTGTYDLSDSWELALALQQVRATAEFAPTLVVVSSSQDSSGIRELSRRQTVENALSFRTEYRFAKNFSWAANYSVQSYKEQASAALDGTVHLLGTSVAARW